MPVTGVEGLISLGFGGGQLLRQEADSQTAQAAATIAHLQAATELSKAQALKTQQELDVNQRLAAGMAGYFGGGAQSPAGPGPGQAGPAAAPPARQPSISTTLADFARIAANAGAPEKAGSLLKAASAAGAHEATADSARTSQALNLLKAQREQLGLGAQLLGGVTDQASADAAERKYQMMTGESLFEGHPYSPGLVQNMLAKGLTAAQQLDLRLRQQTEDRQGRREVLQDALDRSRIAVNAARKRSIDARQAALDKAGGKGVSGPSAMEFQQAVQLVKKQYPDITAAEAGPAAYAIAARARALRQANRALDADAALRQALTEAAPDFATDTSMLGLKKKTTFGGMGKQPETATPLPLTSDGKMDLGKMKAERYYYNSKGQVAKYVGGGKVELVPNAKAPNYDEVLEEPQ